MEISEMILRLERILAESQAMLEAATQGRWDDLIELEAARRDLIAKVSQAGIAFPDATSNQRKTILVTQILTADDQIKALTQSWMGELQSVLTSVHVERKLIRAYESR